ncbi:MAG: hypothetical protein ACTJLN_02250 [Rickettsia amblyommatis]
MRSIKIKSFKIFHGLYFFRIKILSCSNILSSLRTIVVAWMLESSLQEALRSNATQQSQELIIIS